MMIMSAIACRLSLGPLCADSAILRMTERGMGLTRWGGGSSLPHAFHNRLILKSILRSLFRRGSGWPSPRNVCATPRT